MTNTLSWDFFTSVNSALMDALRELDTGHSYWAAPSSEHTTFKTGGKLGLLLTPKTPGQIQAILSLCQTLNIPWLVIGKGSNSLFRDGGFPGIVMKLADNISTIRSYSRNCRWRTFYECWHV